MRMNPVVYAWQGLIYGVLGRRPDVDLSDLPSAIDLQSHYDKKNKVYWVEAPNLPEFYATGRTREELTKNVIDTVLVYFDIPSYFAQKFQGGELTFTNRKTGEQETIRVNKRKLEKVLA